MIHYATMQYISIFFNLLFNDTTESAMMQYDSTLIQQATSHRFMMQLNLLKHSTIQFWLFDDTTESATVWVDFNS